MQNGPKMVPSSHRGKSARPYDNRSKQWKSHIARPDSTRDLAGDRRLPLRHAVVNGALLHEADAKLVPQHLADLWSYDVLLTEVDAADSILKQHTASPRKMAAAA